MLTRLLAGERGARGLAAVERFMVANMTAIGVVILMVLGAKLTGDALAGLGAR